MIWGMEAPGVAVSRSEPAAVHVLRLHRVSDADRRTLADALRIILPEPTWGAGDPRTLWMGPGEFHILGSPSTQALPPVASTVHLADMTDATIAYHVDGARARDLLAKGCTLDLHPRAFPAGRCARTLLAQVDVVIDHPAYGDRFDLIAERSFADHLERWFADAIVEFA